MNAQLNRVERAERYLAELKIKYATAHNDAELLGAKLELSEHRESEMHKITLRMKGDVVELERDLAESRAENEKLKQEALAAAEAARVEKERVEALAAEERKKAAAAAKAAAAKAKAERDAIEAKAKAEREAVEAAEKVKRERLAVLAAEAQERTEKARAAAESQANADRIARLEVEAQLKAVADAKRAADAAEAKRVADEAEAQRQAALAPDKEKLLGLAMQLRATGTPSLSTADGQAVIALLVTKLDRLASWLEQEASVL